MINFFSKLFKKQTSIKTNLHITSSNGFHLRPIAKFSNEVKKFEASVSIEAKGQTITATQVPKILSLSLEKDEIFTLICTGEKAKKASEHLSSFFVELMNDDKEVEEIEQETEEYEASTLRGQTIAKGISIAPLVQYEIIHHVQEQELPIHLAIDLTHAELSSEYESNKTKDEATIFLAQKELLNSELFQQDFENTSEFKTVILNEITKLKGTKFESRTADYLDIEQRVLSFVGIFSDIKVPDTPYILLADDLLPSDIPKLHETPIQGVILQKGTPTSHASILLRSFAIPSMIINHDIQLSLEVILDANSGNLILEPTKHDKEKAQRKQEAFKEQKEQSFKNRFQTTKTKNGKVIKVLANITDLNSAKEAKELGADGIGLLRTEFLFTKTKPSIEEQRQTYLDIFELFNDITIRTLDIGGDKSLSYIDIPREDNPFLGLRGIRFSLHEQILFKEQLLSIFKTIDLISSNKVIKIMFPMVSKTEEFIEAKNIAQTVAKENNIDISNMQFGIMLEVPSVIFAIKEFDKLVDFYSIGTNDLTQYLFAIERTHPTLTVDLGSPLLMAALKQIIQTTTKPLSICGELAGIETATQELIAMNYQTLSVSSQLIPSLKESIRNI